MAMTEVFLVVFANGAAHTAIAACYMDILSVSV